MKKPRPLYKPQTGAVDITVNVYENESCHHSPCNAVQGCNGYVNDAAGCGVKRGNNFIAGCGGNGSNFVAGCGGGGHNFAEGCGG
jgi:hypothetical protein